MILGMTTFTFVHVLISVIAILSGLVVLWGLLTSKRFDGWTAIFLLFTLATSVTGFFFVRTQVMPAHITGVISLIVLAIAIPARYVFRMMGAWRWIYVVSALAALYLNIFVLIVQLFLKVPSLHALAPQGTEPSFAIIQGIVLVAFIALGFLSVRRFRPRPV